ncbi:unnamed protein product [Phytophthora fragariaefolia]|uniref:Unnamed protein product n=1 Tax=Phytophthora fragariaefolia TaxID=1490495 RepID=A0A9W6XQQ5_9STRA|nr:unnamed protein product [Phytophthora fragariaefolia]
MDEVGERTEDLTSSPSAGKPASTREVQYDLDTAQLSSPAIVGASTPASSDPVQTASHHASVKFIEESEVPERIQFADIGDGEKCQCHGDCSIDSCINAHLTIYCTSDCCGLGAVCSNAPRTLYSPRRPFALRLYDTGRVGLGVFTTAYLEVGDVAGEYADMMCEYDAIVEGQPTRARKDNNRYTMLLHTKSVSSKYV